MPNERTEPSPDRIDLWSARLGERAWPSADRLPASERERAARLREGTVRNRWVAARWALRGALSRYLEEDPAAIELRLGPRGKPLLATPAMSLHFNLSHSDELALVAISGDREVGVDVERIEPRKDLLALARGLAPAEAAALEATAPEARLAAFHAAWTRREAVAKCLGTGLAVPPPQAEASRPQECAVANLDVAPGFAAAVAVAGDALPPVRRFEIEAAELARRASATAAPAPR